MSACRSCGAGIQWAQSEAGRWMPFDTVSSPLGEWVLEPDGGDGNMVAIHDRSAHASARYQSHFATCPNAGQHRRGRLAD